MTVVDASSPDAVVDTIYRLLSGRADEPRDWAAYRELCAPEMRLMAATPEGDGPLTIEVLDRESYVSTRTPLFTKADFYEVDVGRTVQQRGDIAQVWSEYEARRAPAAPAFARGVCSFQVIRREARWWIIGALWQIVTE